MKKKSCINTKQSFSKYTSSSNLKDCESHLKKIKMNKIILCIVLPCILAMVVSAAYYPGAGQYGQYGYGQRNVAQYASYAANSQQALKQARLFNYLLGGLFFLNLFNFTGNTIAG